MDEDDRLNTDIDYVATERDSAFPMIKQGGGPPRFQSDSRVMLKQKLRLQTCGPEPDTVIREQDRDCVAPALGLRNYGENCYVNAGLQCLLCVPELNAYFLEARYRSILYPTAKRGFKVCEALTGLYGAIFAPDAPEWLAPQGSLTLLPSGQQDTHELFLRKLFPMIQDETNPKEKRPRKEDLNGQESWSWYRKQHNSVLDALFAGQLCSQVTCKQCSNTSTAFDPFFDISLSITKNKVELCLEDYFADETLSRRADYRCAKCNTVCPAVKRTKIDRCPRYLMIHLKRLVGSQHKISDYIEYEHKLNLSPYCAEKAEYELAAVCVHSGTARGGHNYAVGRRGGKVSYCSQVCSGISLTTSRSRLSRNALPSDMRPTFSSTHVSAEPSCSGVTVGAKLDISSYFRYPFRVFPNSLVLLSPTSHVRAHAKRR